MPFPLKTSNVSYSVNPSCRTLSVPLLTDDFQFGTQMTDPIWKKAAISKGFAPFKRTEPLSCTSDLYLFRTDTELLIGFFFQEPEKVRTHRVSPDCSLWTEDMAELHFAGLDPDPWLLQLAIGIDGALFDSSGNYKSWQSAVYENEQGWGCEVRLPVSSLRLSEGGIRFNCCRQIVSIKENSTWNTLHIRYHEVENFGEILFGSYSEIATMRTGFRPAGELNEQEFEQLRNTWEVHAWDIIHGPFVSNPDNASLCISWQTAGRVPAFVEYKKKNSGEPPIRLYCGKKNGILAYERNHFVRLTGLEPDTEYEYEPGSLLPVVETPERSGIIRTFRTTPSGDKPFSFFCFSDIHSDTAFLRQGLETQAAQSASFHVLLGDNLSHALGSEAVYKGILDSFPASFRKNQMPDKPIVYVRGNHEQLGIYASEYFKIMEHESGHAWYTFRIGKLFFMVLDSGNDWTDSPDRLLFSNVEMLKEEARFVEETVQTEAYRTASFRIVLMHIPPYTNDMQCCAVVPPMIQAEIRPDIMLSGHLHCYANLKDGIFTPSSEQDYVQSVAVPEKIPFPVVACSNRCFISCTVKNDKLEFTFFRPEDGKPDTVLDTFSIVRK